MKRIAPKPHETATHQPKSAGQKQTDRPTPQHQHARQANEHEREREQNHQKRRDEQRHASRTLARSHPRRARSRLYPVGAAAVLRLWDIRKLVSLVMFDVMLVVCPIYMF